MVEVLHVLIGSMNNGGIESSLMNVYRNINRTEFGFHFLVHDEKENFYEKEIIELGGDLHRIPFISQHFFKHISNFYEFLKSHPEFKVVHIHTTYAITFFDAFISKMLKRKVIVHSHNSTNHSLKRKIFHTFFKSLQEYCADKKISCSMLATNWMFYKEDNVFLWKNPIDLGMFKWNSYTRDKIRKENKINNSITVILNVGRLSTQKNQIFLLAVFERYLQIDSEAVLWLIGDGEDEDKLKKYCIEKNMDKKVKFLGAKTNVADYMQAADVFCFPSLYEGLGIVLIEAQCSNIPIVMSNNLPQEVKITKNIAEMSLNDNIYLWSKMIEKIKTLRRADQTNLLSSNGYDINLEIKKLENLYKELVYEK